MLENFTDKFKEKMSGLKSMFNKNKKESNEELTKMANKQMIQESMEQAKRNKKKTFLQMIEDDNGVIEEYTFSLPQT